MESQKRTAQVTRKTGETDISCTLCLDGSGNSDVHSGIGFLDHMLSAFARHGFFDLTLTCQGDLTVDSHHTIEDTGIVLGTAIAKALGDKQGIRRFGECILPMDEALILAAIDLSGRPVLGFDATFHTERVGGYDTQMVHEFFYAVCYSSGMNLHLKQLAGENDHHIIEGLYKAFAKALDMAVSFDPRVHGVLSTKGSLT